MNFKKLAFCLLLVAAAGFGAFAQTGILKGKVVDSETGEEMLGTNVYLTNDVQTGTITDLFGNFQMSLAPGTYSISTSFVSYHTMVTENVEVKEGEITEILVELVLESTALTTVVIDAKVDKSNDVAVVADRKKSVVVLDGIGGQEISRSGASNAGDAVKQVTGASIEGGKYMVVRGLGDRYSITQLNGVTLPSTDPYRNSASLDLIPSFMLENVMTSKTFSPDQPGNFTGGNLNIKTKSYPEKFFLNFGVSASYNTLSSFKNDFITADGGLEELPAYLQDEQNRGYLPSSLLRARRELAAGNAEPLEIIQRAAVDLNSPMLPTTTNSLLDHSAGVSFGNMHKVNGKHPFGYVFGIKYKKGYNYYNNADFNRWEATKEGMLPRFDMDDERGAINDNIGSYLSLSYQLAANHEITLSGLYNNDVSVFGRDQQGVSAEVGLANLYRSRTMGEKTRSMRNGQFRGTHVFPTLKGSKLEWVAGYTQSAQDEPDLRFFSDHVAFFYDETEGNEEVRFDRSSYGFPNHFFRDLTDNKYDFKIDYKQPLGVKGNYVKFGGLVSRKDRVFNEYRFKAAKDADPRSVPGTERDYTDFFNNFGFLSTDANGDYVVDNSGNFFDNDTKLQNLYTGNENISAAYAMAVLKLTPKMKSVFGARVENTDIQVNSADTSFPVGTIQSLDLLPSLNLVYELTNNSNLRFAASQTLARPNMREMAPFFSIDFLGGFLFTGNPELERTLVRNLDLRWENYRPNGEMIAVSVYYKSFINPIVKVFSPVSSTGEITFDNLDQANVYGFEAEWRKSLEFISANLSNFKFAANVSIIQSAVAIPEEDLEAIDRNYLIMGETRPFQGQSPFLANANLYYKNDSANIVSSLTFNVFGKRLYEIGATGNPDIYEMPRPLLNYNITKTFNETWSVTLSAGNILNTKFLTQQFYKSENPNTGEVIEETYVVERRELGRTFSIGINYKIQ